MTLDEARAELGLGKGSSPVDVRRAFKRLALEHHPDRNPARTEASSRFRRIVLAYEILTGQRAPSPGAQGASGAVSGAAASPKSWRTPDPRVPWEVPLVEVLPIESSDGQPIHYPTAEEIRDLDIEATHPGKMMNRLALIFLAFFVLIAILASLGSTGPAPPDPLRDKLRRSLGRLP